MKKIKSEIKDNNLKITPILAGVSGEYFVAAELSRRGYICSITLKNTKGIDVLVCNEDASTDTKRCRDESISSVDTK